MYYVHSFVDTETTLRIGRGAPWNKESRTAQHLKTVDWTLEQKPRRMYASGIRLHGNEPAKHGIEFVFPSI